MKRSSSAPLFFAGTVLVFLAGCASERASQSVSILGESPRTQIRQPIVDNEIAGSWSIKSAEMAGKPMVMSPELELRIQGDRYGVGIPSGYADRGRIELFGDELAGQARRMDVIGEVGPNKGKRFPALYRQVGRELEIIYDLSGANRPVDFVSREGSQLFRVTYRKKP